MDPDHPDHPDDPDLRLRQLLMAGHPCIAIVTFEEDDAVRLVSEAAAACGLTVLLWSMNGGLRIAGIPDASPIPDTEHPAAMLYHLWMTGLKNTCVICLDMVGHLRDERTLRMWRDVLDRLPRVQSRLVMIDHNADRPAVVRARSTALELPLPDEKVLDRLVRAVIDEESAAAGRPVHVDLGRSDGQIILRNLRGLTRRQARQVIRDVVAADRRLDAADLNNIVAEKRRLVSGEGLLQYMESPVDLAQVGGLKNLKSWLGQRNRAFGPEAAKFGLTSPRGVLMLGVQGAGKSLAAKACATAWQLPLLRMEVGVLYDRYVGESERRLREALRQAEAMAPVVLWIDEIEKAFASAASHSTDGGLSQRMFGTLLTWMQEKSAEVFLIATANDIEALPPELLRKGRFDEIFFVDLPGAEARRNIFEIHLTRRGRDPARFDLPALTAASAGFSGAEIEQAIVSALHAAFGASTDIDTARVLAALRQSPPLSVTMRERIDALRSWAQGRCVAAE
jgi:hypothetical protein